MQFGGIGLFSYKRNPNLTYRIGAYFNSEFSGPFLMLLAGIDWKINMNNNLFGVLPGMITYEHKATDWLYLGATFRAITNSYKVGPPSNTAYKNPFLRIDENQSGIFAAAYFKKRIAITLEAGHSILRKIRLGDMNGSTKYYSMDKVRNNLYLSGTVAYRIRFR